MSRAEATMARPPRDRDEGTGRDPDGRDPDGRDAGTGRDADGRDPDGHDRGARAPRPREGDAPAPALRARLIERYAEHYARVNAPAPSITAADAAGRAYARMFGPLLDALPPGAPILDVGCGAGLLLSWLAAWLERAPGGGAAGRLEGIDLSPSQLERARARLPGVRVERADGLEFLRAHPDRYGAIFCFDVLEHLAPLETCVAWVEAARAALLPGGAFVCRVPNAANLTGGYSRYMDLTHERAFTATSLIELLELGGLHEVRAVPVQAAHAAGRARLALEAAVHRAVFRVCGRGLERVFTYNVQAVGRRPRG